MQMKQACEKMRKGGARRGAARALAAAADRENWIALALCIIIILSSVLLLGVFFSHVLMRCVRIWTVRMERAHSRRRQEARRKPSELLVLWALYKLDRPFSPLSHTHKHPPERDL
jgi:cell division septal protein FtsQ